MPSTEEIKRQGIEWQTRRDQLQNEHETVVRGLHRLMNFKIEFQHEKHRINNYITGQAHNEWDSASDPLVVEFSAHEARVEKVFHIVYQDLKDFLSNVYEDEPAESSEATASESIDDIDETSGLELVTSSLDIGANASKLVSERLRLQELLKTDYDRLEAIIKRLNAHREALDRNRANFDSLNNQFCEREAELGAKIEHTISSRRSSHLVKIDSDQTIAVPIRRKWYKR